MTKVKRLYVLLCGYEFLPKSVSMQGGSDRFILSEPICTYLLDTEEGFVLIDCGLNIEVLRNPATAETEYGRHIYPTLPVVLAEHELLPQLAKLGVAPKDIRHVVLSHVHIDHTGELRHFRHARVSIQACEHVWAFGQPAVAVRRADYDFPDIDWNIVEGDWRVMDGLDGLLTAGHTPGHQSFAVTLPSGAVKILTMDAGDLLENFEQEIVPGSMETPEAGLPSIRKLKRIAAQRRADLILLHDPNLVQTLKIAPDFYS
ncbi:MAG: N-acyl homoserine lactonase family protein [Hyphomicrobiaceae bacterium]